MVDENKEVSTYPTTSTLTTNPEGKTVLVTKSGPTKQGMGTKKVETREDVGKTLKNTQIRQMGGIPKKPSPESSG